MADSAFVQFTFKGNPVYYSKSYLRSLKITKITQHASDKTTCVWHLSGSNEAALSFDEPLEKVVEMLNNTLIGSDG